jgi:membrane dipeptidase
MFSRWLSRTIVMVNFYPENVSSDRAHWNADRAGEQSRYNSPPYDGLYIGQPERAKAAMAEWEKSPFAPVVTIAMVADHIDHIRGTRASRMERGRPRQARW